MAKRKMKIDLNQIDNFAYALQTMKAEVAQRVREVAEKWAAGTKSRYDSVSGHATIKGKKSFYRVEEKRKALYVAVGHESYIARFLEVGTKSHEILHRQGNGISLARVRGIKGNKALAKAIKGNEPLLNEMIGEAVELILKK